MSSLLEVPMAPVHPEPSRGTEPVRPRPSTLLGMAGLTALLTLAGCECGPGVVCKTDADCGEGRCVTLGATSGYCVARSTNDGGAQPDAGTDAGLDGGSDPDAGTDAGFPHAVISTSPLDFGLVGCGRPEVQLNLDLENTGPIDLTFNAATTGAFTVSMASGSVAAGTTTRLKVGASVVASAAAGVDQTGTLSITTDDPFTPKVDVPLKLKSAGVTLALTPGIGSFGLVPVNTAAPAVGMNLTNLGNVDATLSFAAPADSQFSVTWSGAPATLTVAPTMSATGLSVGFKPTGTTPASSSSVVTVAEAVCGVSVGSIPLTGQGTNGSVGISSFDVSFGANGRVNCGTQAAARTITLSNTGNQAFSWTGTLAKGTSSPFAFSPTSGTVPATSGMATITITPATIPAQATTAADAFGDTLSIVTDVANDSSHPIALHQTANGAVLSFSQSSLDFGLVPINGTANAPFSVVNDGNVTAMVTLASNNPSFSVAPVQQSVAGTSAGAVTGTFAPGSSVAAQTAQVTLSLDGGEVLCAPLPAAMTMGGQGTNGSVSYTPVALDFGSVNCGATAAAKTVTFSNNGNQSYTVVPVLGKGAGSAFTVSMAPDSGVVAQDGGSLVITVTPKQVPATSAVTANLYGDTLTVTSDVSGDVPHDIALRETARGSIFAVSTNNIGFGSVAVGITGSTQFTVTNNGNAAGTIKFTPTQPSIFGVPASVAINAQTSTVQTASFSPTSPIGYSDAAVLSAASGTVLCQPLPFPSIALGGTGSNSNVVLVSTGSVAFGSGGLVPCGTTAAPKSVTVTNNSSVTLALQYRFTDGGSTSPYYAVSGPAALDAGIAGSVTLTPTAIPATSTTADNRYGETLTIAASGGPVNEAHTVALTETAQGGILSFSTNGLNWSSSSTQNFSVNNTGNLAASYSLSLTGANSNLWMISPTGGTADGPGSVSTAATYSRPLLGGMTNASVTLMSTAGLCAPIPTPLPLHGN